MSNQSEGILAQALSWVDEGWSVAVATVVQTWGSAPCPVGSVLALRSDREFVGSVSGGCVEAEVIQLAMQVLDSGRSAEINFGIHAEDSWQAGLACGGQIGVYVEVLK